MPESRGYYIPREVAIRAFKNWTPGKNGCCISTYSVASHGYAQIGWFSIETGKMTGTTAHRAAWTRVHRQIPAGMTVDHKPTCDRRCVNVKHLRLLTNFENGRRTFGRDWPLGQCINGHPNSELIVTDGGRRVRCRLCYHDQQRAYLERNRDRVRQSQRAYYERNRKKYAEWQRARRRRKAAVQQDRGRVT